MLPGWVQAQARRVAVARHSPALPDTVLCNWRHAAVGTLLAFLMRHTYNATLLTGSNLQVEASDLLHLLAPLHNQILEGKWSALMLRSLWQQRYEQDTNALHSKELFLFAS